MADIGSSLREARMRARIDITEVETRTKIRAKYLRALENEEWSLLPGPVYVRSFLKTYGDYLGLDSRLLVDEFRRRYEVPSDHDQRTSAARARDRERERARARPSARITRTLVSPIGLIVASLIVIVVALYVIGSHSGTSHPAGSATTIRPSSGTTTPSAPDQRSGTRRTKHPKKRVTTPLISTTTSATVTTPPALATLSMAPTSTIWVCVESASGKALYTGEYSAGENMPTESGRTLLVTLGNDDVTMTVNGKAYTPPRGSPVGLKITPKGVTSLTTPPVCQ